MTVCVLRALAEKPRSLKELRRLAGSSPAATTRGHLRTLAETGLVTRIRRNDFPGSVDFEITDSGRELWAVGKVLGTWLERAPDGPVELGGLAARNSIRALADGWKSRIVRAVVARPMSLTELNEIISGLSYPSLERRVNALRLAGLIEKVPSESRGTPYTATPWLRRAAAPLVAAARWERLNVPTETAPISPLDVEATFLLAIPMLTFPAELSGACRLTVTGRAESGHLVTGVLVDVSEGQLDSCVADVKCPADAWVTGSVADWLGAIIDGQEMRLETGGDVHVARPLVTGLQGAWDAMLRSPAWL